ncbi:MAG: hypothetical protein NVS4B7_02490 [Ktedonobacteraceae bacterium]
MADLVLYNSFHTTNAEGWYYVYTPAKQYQNWKYDGPTFYAYSTQVSGTVPIYQDSAPGTPQRYRLTADPTPGQGWQRNPKPVFYAYPYARGKPQPTGTVPVYTYYAVGTEGWRYSYTTEGLWGICWRYAGIDFYAPTPDGHTYPPYNVPPSIVKLPAQDEYQLGWGINAATGTLGAFAVKGLQVTSYNDFKENRDLKVFSSSSDFEDAAVSLAQHQSCGLGNKFSVSLQFLSSTSISDLCLSLEVDSDVQTRVDMLDLGHSSPQIDPAALNLLKQDPAGFVSRYGTHFIGGFIYGGYFTGALNLRTHAASQKTQLVADLKHSEDLWLSSESTSAQFQADLANTQVQNELEASATISGQPVTVNIGDPDSLLNQVEQFANQLNAQPDQGIRQVAICYTWDVLPGVVQILNGIDPKLRGVFQSAVNPFVALALTQELARLSYLQNTVTVLLNGTTTLTEAQQSLLTQSKTDLANGMVKITSLQAENLSLLNLQSVQQYEVAATIRQKINPLLG